MNEVKGWIFVSHSTKDLEPVRRIRDYLEAKSHQPLLFFLKCIRDTDELDSLITREIEARTIFLLCDSPNSRTARWVQREVEFIQSLRDRHYEVIDITAPWPTQQTVLDRLSQHSTLFLSYAYSDAKEVSAIYEALRTYDYSIFFDQHSLGAGGDWRQRTEHAINESLSTGFFILFASPISEHHQSFQFAELQHALAQQPHFRRRIRNFIPVLIGDRSSPVELPPVISEYQVLDLRGKPPLAQAEHLHKTLCNIANEPDGNA